MQDFKLELLDTLSMIPFRTYGLVHALCTLGAAGLMYFSPIDKQSLLF